MKNYGIETQNNDTVGFGGGLHDQIGLHLGSVETIYNGANILGSNNLVYKFGSSSINGGFADMDANMFDSTLLPTSVNSINMRNDDESFYVGWLALSNPLSSAYYYSGISATNIHLTDITPVPEPTTILLFSIGLLGLAGVSRNNP